MTFACIQNCNMCPFRCNQHKSKPVNITETKVEVKPETVKQESVDVTENGLAVVENIPVFEVKRNLFGKEKVVRKV